VNVTAWSQGLEVSGDGTGVVSHAGIGLLRHLADKTGLTGELSAALAPGRLLKHDRGRVLADLACSIADGARVISDFRVMGDQGELFGPVASVPTAYRTLEEIADGGDRPDGGEADRRAEQGAAFRVVAGGAAAREAARGADRG
jgi:hypothetical protein